MFCNRIARKAAKDLGIQKEKKVLSGVEERIGAGVQPRRAHNDLVPEYAEVLSFANATDKEVENLCHRRIAHLTLCI